MSLPDSLHETLRHIEPPDARDRAEAQRRLDQLTKPQGSLGRLETIAAQCHAITRGDMQLPLRKGAYVFAADHGVAVEGVSAYPSEVTAQMVRNFLQGGAAINVLARLHGVSLAIIDVGVDAEFQDHPALWQRKVARGSRNMRLEAAMSPQQLERALAVGIEAADDAERNGYDLVAAGEMGIGNTTAASAIAAALTHAPAQAVTGSGTGIQTAARHIKQQVIREALQRHCSGSEAPHALEVLRCVGGLEIAAMTGFFLGAARRRRIVIVDGFIATAAAAVAAALAPSALEYFIAGHRSLEPGHSHLLRYLRLEPILDLQMRLGEGTGAVTAMPIVNAAVHILKEMATFESAAVSTASA